MRELMNTRILLCSVIAGAMLVPVVAQQKPVPASAAPQAGGVAQQKPVPSSAPPQAAGMAPLRVYLRGGLKTHGAGQHDYPQFVADWSNILTERETEVLRLVAEGCSNKEIGLQLHVTEKTVKTHVSNLLEKLGLQDRTRAAIWALKHGLGSEG
jgi:DNA-binding NarL/FixJ family response regulator